MNEYVSWQVNKLNQQLTTTSPNGSFEPPFIGRMPKGGRPSCTHTQAPEFQKKILQRKILRATFVKKITLRPIASFFA